MHVSRGDSVQYVDISGYLCACIERRQCTVQTSQDIFVHVVVTFSLQISSSRAAVVVGSIAS